MKNNKNLIFVMLTKKVITITLICLTYSCQKDYSIENQLSDSTANQERELFEKSSANSPQYMLNSANLDLCWEKAEPITRKTTPNYQIKSGRISSFNNSAFEYQLQFDKKGNIELFASNDESALTKIPARLKLKNGEILSENIFIYFSHNKNGDSKSWMVQYGKNKSENYGSFTGKIIVTLPIESKSQTFSLEFKNNQLQVMTDVTSLYKKMKSQFKIKNSSSRFKSAPFCEEDGAFYYECPPGLSYSINQQLCIWTGTDDADCPGYYQDLCGNTYSACISDGYSVSTWDVVYYNDIQALAFLDSNTSGAWFFNTAGWAQTGIGFFIQSANVTAFGLFLNIWGTRDLIISETSSLLKQRYIAEGNSQGIRVESYWVNAGLNLPSYKQYKIYLVSTGKYIGYLM